MAMNIPSEGLLLNALQSIDSRLAKIERWMEQHDKEHRDRSDNRTDERVSYEARLSRLEVSTNVKAGIGGAVAMVFAVFETLRQLGFIR